MPRKRIKNKRVKILDLNFLTDDLFEALVDEVSISELIDAGPFEDVGFYDGSDWLAFDKSDAALCAKMWDLHGQEVIKRHKASGAKDDPWIYKVTQNKE